MTNVKQCFTLIRMNSSLKKACDLIGATNLARAIGVSPQAINEWAKGGKKIPIERCAQIEKQTAQAVCCEDLRPDKKDFWEYMRSPSSNPKPKR